MNAKNLAIFVSVLTITTGILVDCGVYGTAWATGILAFVAMIAGPTYLSIND